jgi:hypothetical protein
MLFSSFTARAGLAAALVAGLWAVDARVRPAPMPAAPALMPAISVQGQPVEAARLQRVAMGDVPMPPGTTAAYASSLLPMPAGSPSTLSLF